jgi:dolichol-phosphate mannosyltransferase
VAIPVFNEQSYLLRVLERTARWAAHILVIDDGSTDDTPRLLDRAEGIAVIRHEANLGYGRSLADAFRYAEAHGYDWLITMDCDEQHEPERIPRFMDAACRNDADIISGSRYLETTPGHDAPPADRRKINARITAMLNERLGLHLTDAFCGFKAYRVRALSRLAISEDGYAMPLQLWVQAVRHRLRIRELPVPLIYHDATRSFGGGLDDPQVRHRHYLDVFEREMRAQGMTQACPNTSSPNPMAACVFDRRAPAA